MFSVQPGYALERGCIDGLWEKQFTPTTLAQSKLSFFKFLKPVGRAGNIRLNSGVDFNP